MSAKLVPERCERVREMIAVCESSLQIVSHMCEYSITKSQTLTNTSRDHTSPCRGSIQGCRDAPHMHSTDPNPDAANLSTPPHLPHTYVRISARTTADQHAAKPGVQQNARASNDDGARARLEAACGDAIDSAASIDRRLPPLAAPRGSSNSSI